MVAYQHDVLTCNPFFGWKCHASGCIMENDNNVAYKTEQEMMENRVKSKWFVITRLTITLCVERSKFCIEKRFDSNQNSY